MWGVEGISNRFEGSKRAGAGTKHGRLGAHVLEHGYEEIAERGVVVLLEGVVLAVVDSASGEDDGEVGVVVLVGVAHVAAEEDHGAIEEAVAVFAFGGEILDQFL
ncbi:MAG: hypothetical protein RL693_871 [Verrucomicrobiota bacterium]